MKVLITGGTGSFGMPLTERLLETTDYEIIVFSRDEYRQFLMREKFNNPRIKYVIGDIRDKNAVKKVCSSGIDYIFHSAAMKHVNICEENPFEAVLTNIIGTDNVLEAAIKYKVKKVIILSTDKAVYPQNTMGLTKALAERLSTYYAKKSETQIMITRFGNLMLSNGSVLEKFISLAKQGRSLKVTSPNMERFMMTIDDAIDLVLFAFNSNSSGHIFVKKAKVFNILDMAKSVNILCKNDAPIQFIQPVRGEKEVENLLAEEYAIDHGEYYEIDPSGKEGEHMTVSSNMQDKESIETITKLISKYVNIQP